MLRQQKGITLIALVITIVVFLILAGVSIAMISKDNGILTKATKAKDLEDKYSALEAVQLEVAGSFNNYSDLDMEKVATNVSKKLGATSSNYGDDLIVDYANYKFLVDTDGNVTFFDNSVTTPDVPETPSEQTLLSQITSANYGDKVIYTANGVSDWKILYKDTTNVYIVASDYLAHGGSSDTSKIVSGTGMTKSDTYRAYWSSAPSSANTTNHVAKFSPVTAETKAWTGNYSTNSNGKCVSTLLDTKLWSAYASGVGGESAIGSPTLNMFVASWNEKYPSDKIYCNNDSTTGYYIGTSSAPSTYYADLSGKTGYGNTLYYPYQSTVDSGNCSGYWLASPSAYAAGRVLNVYCSGDVRDNDYGSTIYGVRPVVSLSSSIKGTSTTTDGVTTWTLSN